MFEGNLHNQSYPVRESNERHQVPNTISAIGARLKDQDIYLNDLKLSIENLENRLDLVLSTKLESKASSSNEKLALTGINGILLNHNDRIVGLIQYLENISNRLEV